MARPASAVVDTVVEAPPVVVVAPAVVVVAPAVVVGPAVVVVSSVPPTRRHEAAKPRTDAYGRPRHTGDLQKLATADGSFF